MFIANSVKMLPHRSQGSSAGMYRASSARMCQGSNVSRFPVSSVAMFLVSNVIMFHDSSAVMFHHRSAIMFRGNSAAMFLVSSASRFLSKFVMLLNQLMEEGSKKAIEKTRIFKSDKGILAETLKESFQNYSIHLSKKQTDDILAKFSSQIYLFITLQYLFRHLVKS